MPSSIDFVHDVVCVDAFELFVLLAQRLFGGCFCGK